MAKSTLSEGIWSGLNERQRTYLQTLYDCDQAQEELRRLRAARGDIFDRTPASEWRWVMYGPTPHASLYEGLRGAGLVDQGTGSTWDALETRGLVQTGHIRDPLGLPLLRLKITALGRKVVRAATAEPPKPKKVKGQLKERQWAALVRLIAAGDEGLSYTVLCLSRGGFDPHWTIGRLLDYKPSPLVRWESRTRMDVPFHATEGWYFVTQAGRWHYEEWQGRYRALYPDVEVPAPKKGNEHE